MLYHLVPGCTSHHIQWPVSQFQVRVFQQFHFTVSQYDALSSWLWLSYSPVSQQAWVPPRPGWYSRRRTQRSYRGPTLPQILRAGWPITRTVRGPSQNWPNNWRWFPWTLVTPSTQCSTVSGRGKRGATILVGVRISSGRASERLCRISPKIFVLCKPL